jgi:predicted ester cyclase
MNEQQMMQIVERAVTRFNANDVEAFLEMYERSVVFHGFPRQLRPGAGGLKDYYSQLRKSFPDMRIATEDLFATQDKLAHRYTIYGTHKAEYLGTAPSNKLVIAPGMMIYHFKGDKVTEAWQMADNYKFLTQIGALAQPALKR